MARAGFRATVVVAAILLVVVAMAGCTSTASQRRSAPLCPSTAPSPGWIGASGPSVNTLVPAGAVSLVDCTYHAVRPVKGSKGFLTKPIHGTEVRGSLAVAAYAALLREQRAASTRCATAALKNLRAGNEPGDVLLWTYATGKRWALVTGGRCSSVVGNGGDAVTPDGAAQVLLIGLSAAIAEGPGAGKRPVPNLVGLPLAQAAARQRGLTVVEEMSDPSAPFGTVVLAGPPAGTPNLRGSGVQVIVAAHRVAVCRPAELGGFVAGGEPGAGTSFARLTLWDTGRRPCLLPGRLRIDALGPGGAVLGSRTVGTIGGVAGGLVLAPETRRDATGSEIALVAVGVLSSTDYAGNCTKGHALVRAWRVTMLGAGRGSTLPDLPSGQRPRPNDEAEIITCGGWFGAGPFALPGNIQL
jgi:hypothetical protein